MSLVVRVEGWWSFVRRGEEGLNRVEEKKSVTRS